MADMPVPGRAVRVHDGHGPTPAARAVSRMDGAEVALEISLPRDRPLALWRVSLRNVGRAPLRVGELDLLSAGDGSVRLGDGALEPAFFVSGSKPLRPVVS